MISAMDHFQTCIKTRSVSFGYFFTPPRKIDMDFKKRRFGSNAFFPFNWMVFRFQPFFFRGVSLLSQTNVNPRFTCLFNEPKNQPIEKEPHPNQTLNFSVPAVNFVGCEAKHLTVRCHVNKTQTWSSNHPQTWQRWFLGDWTKNQP